MFSLLHVHSDQVMSWNLLLCRKRPSFQNGFGLDQYQKRCGHHSHIDLPRADWHTVIDLRQFSMNQLDPNLLQFDDANLQLSPLLLSLDGDGAVRRAWFPPCGSKARWPRTSKA